MGGTVTHGMYVLEGNASLLDDDGWQEMYSFYAENETNIWAEIFLGSHADYHFFRPTFSQ